MLPHQERVITERNELVEKITKLDAFLEKSPVFDTLSEDEQHRLVKQINIMKEYLYILEDRIDNF